jgi:F-type H+-transporting ATPase subunit b
MPETGLLAEPRTWVAVAFVIFFVIFGKKLWTVVAGMLDSRAVLIRAELDAAQQLRREAEAMLIDAKQRREAAIADATSLLASARHEAERLAAAAAADAEASAARRERMAMDRMAAAETAAIDDVRLTAADVAAVAAQQVIRETLSPDANAALVDHAIGALPAALRAA